MFTICGYTYEFVLGLLSCHRQKNLLFQQVSDASTKEINLQRKFLVWAADRKAALVV